MEDGDSGYCHISAKEVQRLHQLTTEWVERAVENLSEVYGPARLRRALSSEPGLQLHSQDAVDPLPSGGLITERFEREDAVS